MADSTDKKSALIELDDLKAFEDAIQSDKVTIIDFWASWCGPCLAIAPWYKEQAEKYSSDFMQVCKCDVDDNAEASEKAGISCMPTFKIYKSGECLKTIEGADKAALSKMFELDADKIEDLKKQQAEEAALIAAMEKLMPMVKNKASFDEFTSQDGFRLVNFYVDGYDDDCDNLKKKLKEVIEDENESKINTDNVRRVDLQQHGMLGNQLKIRSLPHLRVYKDGKLVETVDADDIDLVKKLVNMSDDEIKQMLEDKEKEAERLKKLVPQLDEFAEYETFIQDEENLSVVDYYATWCGPCIMFAPTFCKMADSYQKEGKKVKFCKIDCDKNKEAKKHGEINCFPTFKLYKNGKEVGKCTGAGEKQLRDLIDAQL